MSLIKFLFLLVFILAIDMQVAHAGNWPQPKGGYYIKLSEWWMVSDKHFDSNGDLQSNILEYGYYATTLYAEYGLGKRTTLTLHFPFINYAYTVLNSAQVKQSILKTGDADVGLKYGLNIEEPLTLSASLILGLPLGYNENGALLTGDGEFNQMIKLDALKYFTLLKANTWLNIYTGFNNRSSGFADELHYGIQTGFDISKNKLTLILMLQGIDALGEMNNAIHVNPQSLFSNYKEYINFSPELTYYLSPTWGITIGAGTTLTGKNIFANPSFTIGIFNQMKEYNTQ
ncbi:MAG TPA: hypothetical protein VMZ69_07875 [Saprospiraceae bacterium]|nr:hypothetical protein [Saprospiraceae bacterium]